MKKLLFVVLALFVFSVRADNTITSKEYADGQVATLQTQIPAKNTNTVVTNTGTAGTVGEKAIYDTTAAYNTQTDALVTAGAFNSAVQNALESEFVCIEWLGDVHDNAHCLLYEVRGATQMQTLPAGYTQLEYIESTGPEFIDTGVAPTSDVGVSIKYAFTQFYPYNHMFGSFSPHFYLGVDSSVTYMVASFGSTAGSTVLSIPLSDVQLNTPYTLNINFYNSKQVAFVGISQAPINKPAFSANGKSMWMFASTANRGKGKIYNMQITDGATLVRNFIPARRDSDGELGMYDTVSNTFFTNSGTDEFVAGPVFSYLPQNQQ